MFLVKIELYHFPLTFLPTYPPTYPASNLSHTPTLKLITYIYMHVCVHKYINTI